jgi:hypothetical protein
LVSGRTTERKLSHIRRLQEQTSQRIYAYDFHTPDTVACVILEFIDAFGAGAKSLIADNISSEKSEALNGKAMALLRAMVGERGAADFSFGEPLNLDNEFGKTLLLRRWHSMGADERVLSHQHGCLLWPETERGRMLKGTLGGWYVGVLKPAPSMKFGYAGIARLVAFEKQRERFLNSAGLPTLERFYTDTQLSTMRDTATGLSLEQLGRLLDNRLLRRSQIPKWQELVQSLWKLHSDLMQCEAEDAGEIYRKWTLAKSDTSRAR